MLCYVRKYQTDDSIFAFVKYIYLFTQAYPLYFPTVRLRIHSRIG